MKIAVGAVLFAVGFGFAIARGAVPSSTTADGAESRDLHEHMMGFLDQLKTIAQHLQAGKTEECLEAATRMQELALSAKHLDPANLEEVPEEQRADHRRSFRIAMVQLLSELSLLEIELLEGKRDEAWARVSGSLFQLRESSHERFQSAD